MKKNGLSNRIYYSSFDIEVLQAIHDIDATAILGWSVSRTIALEKIKLLPIAVLFLEHTLLKDEDQIRELQKKGFRVIPWTVNDPDRWKELIEMGVDGIIIDYPKSLLNFIQLEQ